MKRFALLMKTAAVCAAAALMIIFSENTAASIVNSINVCVSSIIPSMFAVMAVSAYMISEGYYRTVFRPLYFLLHRVIRLDKHTFAVFLLSMIGGYPAGIKLLKERAENDRSYIAYAEKAAVFCYCISPPFAVNLIGAGIYHSAQAGVVVYLSNVISCLLTAAVYTRFFGLCGEYEPPEQKGGLINAVDSASRSMFAVCAVLIAFNAALETARSALEVFSVKLPAELMGVFEITNLLSMKDALPSTLPFAAAIAAFGGVCVIIQCFAVCGGAFPMKRFLIGRAVNAALSAGICRLLLCFMDVSIPASGGLSYSYRFSTNTGVWILLVLMAVIFFEKNKKIFKKG